MLFGFMNTTGENISKIAPSSRNRNFHTLQRIEVDEHDQECILVRVRMFFSGFVPNNPSVLLRRVLRWIKMV